MKNAVTRTDLNTKLAVPTADVADNVDLVDVVGNKTDAAVTTAGTTKSIMAYIKGLISNVSTVDTVVDGIQTDLSNATDGLGAIKTAVDTVVDSLVTNRPKLVERTASNLPQSTQTAYFTVTGKVLISDIVGEVSTVIEAGTNNLKLISNPTVGADVDLCAVVDIDADAVGTMYHITGTLADAMVATTSGAFSSQTLPIVLSSGTIDLYCSASKTGQTKWVLYYLPLSSGAIITTA